MEFLKHFPFPRRLASRVWLLTLPSGLISFERRQSIPKLPIGRGRFVGLLLIAAGAAVTVACYAVTPAVGRSEHCPRSFRADSPASGTGPPSVAVCSPWAVSVC